jgi:2-dehydro-3-deoxyphosphooctonate aldolase (KDO 8-P synthase)
MAHVVGKIHDTGNRKILLTERGSSFGYNNLVVDMRSLHFMKKHGLVIFDATHSAQFPGGGGDCSGGDRSMVGTLARAAVGAGVDGIFMEVHEDPDRALCDGPNSIALADVEDLLDTLLRIHAAVKGNSGETGEGQR